MDTNTLKKIIKIFESSSISDLEVEQEGLRIKLAKQSNYTHIPTLPAGAQVVYQPQSAISQETQSITPTVEEKKPEIKEEGIGKYHEVRSPIVGTFYRAPAPDADPYVKVGDHISVGTVLCIVEAMKLMNEIESDISGNIIKVLVDNGKPVEYNQPLFLVEPD
ncbi:MAG: acetyl-CoA carboxylase biotin carboxyl carrier protein [Ignavibacterium sp.]